GLQADDLERPPAGATRIGAWTVRSAGVTEDVPLPSSDEPAAFVQPPAVVTRQNDDRVHAGWLVGLGPEEEPRREPERNQVDHDPGDDERHQYPLEAALLDHLALAP